MYNLRPRNKSDNIHKYYLDEYEDSFTPKKNRKKTKNKTKAKTKNKRNNKKSINIKPEKVKINNYQKSNEIFPIISYISEIQDQIDYPKIKTKKYHDKSKEKITFPTNKKDNKRKKESSGNFRKEYEIKAEKYINIKKEELKEYDYIKNIEENKRRYNTINVGENDKTTKGKVKKEQNKKSTKRGNTKIFEKTKESISKEKNNKKRNSKIEKSLNKSYDYDKIHNNNKYKNKSSSIDPRKTENKSNFSNDRKKNNNYKNGYSYNKHKFKVILDESDEEDISDIDEKPKSINKKNIKRLENRENNKYEKDKSKYNQKGKNKVEKSIKNNKVKIKKEENIKNSIKIHNNIIDIDKSLLNESFNFNQYLMPQIYSNPKNFINKKKTSDKNILKARNTEFRKKLFKCNDEDLEKYKYSTCQINDELFTVTLNRFPKSNDIQIKIKLEDNEEDEGDYKENNIKLLGNKRKRNIKKEKIEDKKSKKKTKKRNKKEIKEKEEKIKKEKKPKKNKSAKNENQKMKKQKSSNIKVIQLKKEIEYYEDDKDNDNDNEYGYGDYTFHNNNINVKSKSKKGTKKLCSMKKKEKVKKLDIKEESVKDNHEDDNVISSCSSLSDGDKNMKKISVNDSKNSIKYENNKNKSLITIKSEENDESESDNYQRMEGEESPIYSLFKNNIDVNIENKEIKENNISYDNYDNCDDIIINKNNISDFSNKQYSYSSFENSFDYSFPIEYEDKIQIKEDVTYFGRNTRYIKYNPIDEYATPIPIKDKKNFKNKITKPKYVNFLSKSKKDYNAIESDFTDITSSNNNNDGNDNEIPAILCIPRIKPFKEEHSKKIINKLKNCRIPLHKILDEKVKKEEQKLYIGSFILYDENTNIKVSVPCYRENEIMKEFMRRKNLGIIEFQEDNDIDTDEEQLQLEIERNNEALINFMKKVENDKEYVENNLTRKKRE